MTKIVDHCFEVTGRPTFICDFSPPRSGDPAAVTQARFGADFISVAYNPGRAVRANSAMLAAAIAAGADFKQAVQMANVAGGLEVEKFGCVPVTRDEVLADLRIEHRRRVGKLRSLDDLLSALDTDYAAARSARMRAVLTGALVGAALLAAYVYTEYRSGICDGAQDKLAGVWDAGVEAQVKAAFLATRKPFAAAAWSGVHTALTSYAEAWIEQHIDEWRVLGVLGILAACGTVVTPILWKVQAVRRAESAETIPAKITVSLTCPRCAAGQQLITGPTKCRQCGLRITIAVEEPRCACGYLLYRLQSNRCPECGREIPEADRWAAT